jgi:hypothetical protein
MVCGAIRNKCAKNPWVSEVWVGGKGGGGRGVLYIQRGGLPLGRSGLDSLVGFCRVFRWLCRLCSRQWNQREESRLSFPVGCTFSLAHTPSSGLPGHDRISYHQRHREQPIPGCITIQTPIPLHALAVICFAGPSTIKLYFSIVFFAQLYTGS